MASTVDVYVEVGSKRVFARAVDWPGWCRAGRTEEAALEALTEYAQRYRPVARRARTTFPANPTLRVVERLKGDATTDFGAPGAVARGDHDALTAAQARRFTSLLRAAWDEFDDVVAEAPAELRKGPRGGGRDRDKMVDHVLGSESGYSRKIGLRCQQPAIDDVVGIQAMRQEIAGALNVASDGNPANEKGWPPRYALHRLAWHVLDHAWEMQDRSEPA